MTTASGTLREDERQPSEQPQPIMNDGNFLFQCPNCGQSFDCGELMPGHDWTCPTCGRIFSVQEDNGQQEESDEGRDEDVETMGNEVPKEDSPVFSDKTKKEPSIKGKVMQIPEVEKTAVVNAFRHAKAAFLRLPRRVRWSVVASLVILAGIAFTLGHGSKVDDANNESHETSVAVASPAGNNASAKKSLSDAAKHQKDSATPEALCDEFASGGSHFVRTSATTVWWDVGGETPRFTCEVTFLPGGMARLTQDNTFYAYEEKNRSTNPQILARRLQQSYSQFCRDNYEIKNVKAFATSDGRLLFSGEIPVERGNVSKQIGKVFSALNEARIASRL